VSSYRDHYRLPREGEMGWQLVHSWVEHTRRNQEWTNPGRDHDAAQAVDIAAWSALGRKAAA
jgi:hypothetical protein